MEKTFRGGPHQTIFRTFENKKRNQFRFATIDRYTTK